MAFYKPPDQLGTYRMLYCIGCGQVYSVDIITSRPNKPSPVLTDGNIIIINTSLRKDLIGPVTDEEVLKVIREFRKSLEDI